MFTVTEREIPFPFVEGCPYGPRKSVPGHQAQGIANHIPKVKVETVSLPSIDAANFYSALSQLS